MTQIQQIGKCGVDSGQILVADPQTLVGNWHHEPFNNVRKYQHEDGTVLQYLVDFPDYEAIIPKYGLTMNQINAENKATELPAPPAKFDLSYNACCRGTLDTRASVLGKGLAAVTRTGYGDGVYSVYPIETVGGEKVGAHIAFTERYDLHECLQNHIGEIDCTSGKILFTDPCYIKSQKGLERGELALAMRYASEDGHTQLAYDMGHNGLGVVVALPEGEYDVFVDVKDHDDWGKRVAGLAILPKNFSSQ